MKSRFGLEAEEVDNKEEPLQEATQALQRQSTIPQIKLIPAISLENLHNKGGNPEYNHNQSSQPLTSSKSK
jgi:hypothetical protein